MRKNILKRTIRFGLLVSILSTLANLLYFYLSKVLGEQYLIPFTDPPTVTQPMSVLMVILVTFLSAILATALYAMLAKVAPNATLSPFLSITGTAFLVSLGGPIELPGTVLQTKLLLIGMHIIAALIIIGGFIYFHKQSKINI